MFSRKVTVAGGTGRTSRAVWIIIAFAATAFVGVAVVKVATPTTADVDSNPPALAAEYVGQRTCAACHRDQSAKWSASDHATAMQVVNEHTVLGDFNGAQFTYAGVTSTFFRRDGAFFVRTDGPDGLMHEYQIAYTFGVRPLQQYLIAFPDGKLQPLGMAWDSRPKNQGGERWFHLYPDARVTHRDPLHWTGRNQNWNFMCASCHSTNLQRNYDVENDRYDTSWSEINVSCEACHGPGSRHVAWAQAEETNDRGAGSSKGLVAMRTVDEVDTCAQCHARARPMANANEAGQPLLDTHMPTLLENGMYFSDGQVLDEVFEYGSFAQSKMYRAGVTCSDCHDPHSARLLRPSGNATCTSCHISSTFDVVQHHRHTAGTEAARCVNCHMAERTYMVVDGRRDHSFRVPRPDLSATSGAPNACTQCHTTQSPQWAADAVARWYGPNRRREEHYGTAFEAGRKGLADAERGLVSAAGNSELAPIVQATALSLLTSQITDSSLQAIAAGVAAEDAIVRVGAARALEQLPGDARVRLGAGLLRDPVRAVRVEAARVFAGSPPALLSPAQREHLERAVRELIAAEMASAERPESHLNLGTLYVRLGQPREAERSLRTALRLDRQFIPAMINLADLYRERGRDQEGETLLRDAIALAPRNAEAIHSLGLLLVRQRRTEEALTALRQASALAPNVVGYAFALGLALREAGDVAGAIAALRRGHDRQPADREILTVLIALLRESGDPSAAHAYAEKLLVLEPGNHQARAMLQQHRSVADAPP
jgi:predicted CXXCH cytochrome family protein